MAIATNLAESCYKGVKIEEHFRFALSISSLSRLFPFADDCRLNLDVCFSGIFHGHCIGTRQVNFSEDGAGS
ncbi:MAG: hypothetical protein ACRD3B_12535, partial [Candidatus Sulfotelmatobacter sp.]